MTVFALITISASLAASALVSLGARRLPTLRMQLAALALYAAAVPLVTVSAAGLVMMKMHEDLGVLYVSAACGATALVVAFLLGRAVANRIERLVDTAGELASGDPNPQYKRARSFSDPRTVRLGARYDFTL